MKKKKDWILILKLFSLIALGCHVIHLIWIWTDIPSNIAIHFTNGEADNWGSKYVLLIMPVLGLLTWWLVGLFTKRPEKFNYINLTETNRDKQYKMAGNVMAMHRTFILFAFTAASESFVKTAIADDKGADIFFMLMIVSLISMLLAMVYHVIWSVRLKDE